MACAEYIIGGVVALLVCAVVRGWQEHQAREQKWATLGGWLRTVEAVNPLWQMFVCNVIEHSRLVALDGWCLRLVETVNRHVHDARWKQSRQHGVNIDAITRIVDFLNQQVSAHMQPLNSGEARERN